VYELLLDKNHQMLLGRFERNAQNGELRFNIAVPYRDSEFTRGILNWCLRIGPGTVDELMPEIEAAAAGSRAKEMIQV
jgi:hypothetical protein